MRADRSCMVVVGGIQALRLAVRPPAPSALTLPPPPCRRRCRRCPPMPDTDRRQQLMAEAALNARQLNETLDLRDRLNAELQALRAGLRRVPGGMQPVVQHQIRALVQRIQQVQQHADALADRGQVLLRMLLSM